MKNLLFTFLLFIPITLMAQLDNSKVVLHEGTIIKATLLKDISGKDVSIGQTLEFELSENIIINDAVAVPAGVRITGTVTEAEKSKALGKKGKLAFSIDYMYLPKNKVVKLRSQVEKNIKGSGAAVAAGAILLSPLALLINGKNAKYEKGEVFSAYIDKEMEL